MDKVLGCSACSSTETKQYFIYRHVSIGNLQHPIEQRVHISSDHPNKQNYFLFCTWMRRMCNSQLP